MICTNWGAFVETVPDGLVGFQIAFDRDFDRAINNIKAGMIDPETCRRWVANNFSLDVAGKKYEEFFKRVIDFENNSIENSWYSKTMPEVETLFGGLKQ